MATKPHNINVFVVLSTLLYGRLSRRSTKVLDYAGGYGLLTRSLRDIGINAFHTDPLAKNLFAKNFTWEISKLESNTSTTLVTSFEVFEHLVNPIETFGLLSKHADNILISTEIPPTPLPSPTDWPYYGLEHGQHIGFFRIQTLRYIADYHKFNLYSDGKAFHFFSKKRLPPYVFRLIIKVLPKFQSFLKFRLETKIFSDQYVKSSSTSSSLD